MTNEIKQYIDNMISYMNHCRDRSIELSNTEDFSIMEYNLLVERCATLYVMVDDLVKIFELELVKDKNGFYSVI